MKKILLAVDGSPSAIRATQALIGTLLDYKEMPELHVLTVHRPLPSIGTMATMIADEMRNRYYQEECDAALVPCVALLDAAKVPYKIHRSIGPLAETIVDTAVQLGCNHIYMGTRGHSAVTNVVIGSVAAKVVHLAKMPVTLVH